MKTTATDLMQAITGWGSWDISHTCELADSFEVDLGDIDFADFGSDFLTEVGGINVVIQLIFEEALNNVDIKWREKEDRVNIYTNSIDSHLYIDNEEVYSMDELREAWGEVNDEDAEEEIDEEVNA